MHSKAAAQVINCWQTAADPKQTLRMSLYGKLIPSAKKESYSSNTQNNHAYRGDNHYRDIPTLGWHMGMVSATTRCGAGAG